MDRRWQLVLDCLDTETQPFSKPTLIAFRQRLIATQMDRRLLERRSRWSRRPRRLAAGSCGQRWIAVRSGERGLAEMATQAEGQGAPVASFQAGEGKAEE
jgi:hypothetical protein